MNINCRMIITDMDGTLLNNDSLLTTYTKNVIKKARENNIKIVIASGRDERMLLEYMSDDNLADYIISCNGATIRNNKTKELIAEVCLSDDVSKSIVNDLLLNKLNFTMYSKDIMYYTSCEKINLRIEKLRQTYKKYNKVVDFYQINELNNREINYRGIYKIVVYTNEVEIIKDIASKYDAICESTGENMFGIFNSNANKGSAVNTILDYCGINNNQAICFGDYSNDVPMFKLCENSVAMKNSSKDLLEICKYIADTNQEDGVAKFIEEYLI